MVYPSGEPSGGPSGGACDEADTSGTRPSLMSVKVRLFASFREAVGCGELTLKLPDGGTVGQLLAALLQQYPALRPRAGSVHFAVNRRYVDSGAVLNPGDEVVLVPPVSGG